MLETISYLLLILFMLIVFVSLFYEKKTHIPPVPTLPWVKKKILQLLLKHSNKDAPLKIAELGSGWGGVTFQLAKKFPNAHVTGFEISPFPYWYSKIRQTLSHKKVNFTKNSFYDVNLSDFDVIICYLSPQHMAWLKDKFEDELKSDTLIISNAFPILDWPTIDEDETNIFVKIPVFVYKT